MSLQSTEAVRAADFFIHDNDEACDERRFELLHRFAHESKDLLTTQRADIPGLVDLADYVNENLCHPRLTPTEVRNAVLLATNTTMTSEDVRKLIPKPEPQPERIVYVEQPASPDTKPAASYRVVSAADFNLNDLPEPLVDGAINKGSVHSFYGATGAAKTFAVVDMALCVANNRPWFNRGTEHAAVLWVAAEDAPGVKLRVMAWCQHHKVDRAGMPFRLIEGNLFNLHHKDTIEAILNAGRELLDASGLAHLLVVVDTLARATPGADENSGKDASATTAAFDRLRLQLPCTLTIIHHTGKDETKGLRGHSSLGQGIESFAQVRKLPTGSSIEFHKVKNNALPAHIGFALQTVTLGQDRKGRPITSCAVVPCALSAGADFGPKPIRASSLAGKALTVIEDMTMGGHKTTMIEWRDEFVRRHYDGKRKAGWTAFNRATSALRIAQRFHQDGDFVVMSQAETSSTSSKRPH